MRPRRRDWGYTSQGRTRHARHANDVRTIHTAGLVQRGPPLISSFVRHGGRRHASSRHPKRLVHTAQSQLQARHPGLSVAGNQVAEDAQNSLLQAASESEMLVLGSRRLEPVESHLLGDVSMPVVARAERPVVLVRSETGGRASP